MNVKIFLFGVFFIVISHLSIAQKKQCDSADDSLVDLNSISKCSIEKWEDSNNKSKTGTKQLAIRLSSSRRRLIRRRLVKRKKVASGLTKMESNGVNSLDVKDAGIAKIVDLETEIDDSVIMPFGIVHQKPNFVNCGNDGNNECFDKEIAKHIKKHFSYPDDAYDKGIEGKVIVRFKINKNGEVFDIKGTTDYEKEVLKLEAERIISELPSFLPAKHTNKLVNVSYGVPIVFKLNDGKERSKKEKNLKALSFDEVENVPTFKSCEGSNNNESAKCFNTEMVKHIQNNFVYPKLAVQKNITGKVWINFTVDTKGDVKNIKLRGNSYILKTEAKRIISLLPKLNPGTHNGGKVNTKYVLPINFELNSND